MMLYIVRLVVIPTAFRTGFFQEDHREIVRKGLRQQPWNMVREHADA